jgi:hypothetical protein
LDIPHQGLGMIRPTNLDLKPHSPWAPALQSFVCMADAKWPHPLSPHCTGVIKAACPASSDCSLWPSNQATSVTALPPPRPLLPSPTVTYPQRVSACQTLSLDASASSGSGGRPVSFLWGLASTANGFATAANVTAYLTTTANAGNGLSTIALPPSILSPGALTLVVTMTNFLGGTATSDAITTTVVGASAVTPTVTLHPPRLAIYRSQEVALFASASLPPCAPLLPGTLAYRWMTAQPGILSTARDGESVRGGTVETKMPPLVNTYTQGPVTDLQAEFRALCAC